MSGSLSCANKNDGIQDCPNQDSRKAEPAAVIEDGKDESPSSCLDNESCATSSKAVVLYRYL